MKRILIALLLLTSLSGFALPVPHPPMRYIGSSGWNTVLSDQFTSAGIPTHYGIYNGPYGSAPHNCAAPSQDAAPGDGYLYLKMSYLTSGKCGAAWYTGGLSLKANYPQQAITVRYRILRNGVFSHHIIPMAWPSDPNYAWYQAEEDYCETEGYTECVSYLHHGTNSQTILHESGDLTQWHTWRFEQRNYNLKVYRDGLLVNSYYGSSATLPNALRHLVLQQECPHAGCPAPGSGSETIQIDWVTVQTPA